TDVSGVRAVRDYLSNLEREARARFDAGMSVEAAARDISFHDYASWGDAERIAVNLNTLYREFDPSRPAPATTELFALMAELRRDRR
ncbi:MAG: MBL fold metallo-hydrolase, partial [Myxococcota bacterium]